MALFWVTPNPVSIILAAFSYWKFFKEVGWEVSCLVHTLNQWVIKSDDARQKSRFEDEWAALERNLSSNHTILNWRRSNLNLLHWWFTRIFQNIAKDPTWCELTFQWPNTSCRFKLFSQSRRLKNFYPLAQSSPETHALLANLVWFLPKKIPQASKTRSIAKLPDLKIFFFFLLGRGSVERNHKLNDNTLEEREKSFLHNRKSSWFGCLKSTEAVL